jgi:hypothetical protein
MHKTLAWGLFAFVLLAIVGCQTAHTSLAHPGPAKAQQSQAVRFDPYPEAEIGPPMVGVRPPDYQNPISEPARARWQIGNQCPPPGI